MPAYTALKGGLAVHKWFSTLVVAAVAATFAAGSAGSASADPSSHDLGWLVGTWNCRVDIPASAGNPAQTDHGPMLVNEAPDMTMHFHVAAADYNADEYQGYDKKTKTYWDVSSDTTGSVTFETSKDGTVYVGTTTQVGSSVAARDTYSDSAAHTKIRNISERIVDGKWTTISDATCTKP